ncbi:MAG: NusG domain II-containing protein [Syntrophomonadaceae bacterium]|nr:NusG domain II-containing protein [Syntrophomonadaceae bacterium]
MKTLRSIKKADLILVLVLGIIIALIWLWNGHHNSKQDLVAEIIRNGQIIQKVDLNKVKNPKYITLKNGIKITILAEKGRIRVLHADCPNKICVKTGWLSQPGDMAICVPSDTIVVIDVPD